MNKQTFLKQLERELKHIPAEDREDAIAYYKEYFEEMGADDELDVTVGLGSPRELARIIISECADKHVERQNKEGGMKNGAVTVWMVILAICAAPIALPMAMAGVVLLIAFIVVLLAIGISVFAAAAAGLMLELFMIPAIFVTGSLSQSIVCLGLVFLGAGLAVLLFFCAKWICNACVLGVTTAYHRLLSGKRVD